MSDTRHTLLLRLAGPLQSWGVQSRFTIRDTAKEPTKSGVVGLICAALGRPRSAPIDDLAALRMGVRVDREGAVRRDFHTAGQDGFLRARGHVETSDVIPSERYYLADAHFTVGLEGTADDLELLEQVHRALKAPHWPLALGRKAFPPGLPVYVRDGLRTNTALMDALTDHTDRWRPRLESSKLRYAVELVGDDDPLREEADVRRTQPDQPLSFQPRRFAPREVGIFHRSLHAS